MGGVEQLPLMDEFYSPLLAANDRMQVHYSSDTPEWSTPQAFFDKLNDEFHFETDVCANPENAKCEKFYTKEDDGLSINWTGVCWMNPPYGKEISRWLRKAYESSLSGATVVCLIPSRTDTRYFHDYCLPFGEIRFIKGRLKFGSGREEHCQDAAPFPSVVVIFRGQK